MAAPKHAISIGVQASGTLTPGEFVKATNLTSGGTLRAQAGTNGEVHIVTPPDFDFTWKDGDKVSIEISGRLLGSVEKTINKGIILIKSLAATTAKADAQVAVDL